MKTITGYVYYPDSLQEAGGITFFLARSEEDGDRYLGVIGDPQGFQEGIGIALDSGATTHLFPLTAENAAALRERLAWLRPRPLGLQITAGFGDRLGLATPGHVRAVENTAIAPIFAQQSVRENTRTGRTPQQVMDDAMWGLFQTGWHAPWGADADHLKTQEDIDSFFAAGYTFFTIDPGEHVDNAAQEDSEDALLKKVQSLPWDILHSSLDEMEAYYLHSTFQVEDFPLVFSSGILLRALAKYGRALAETVQMAGHLRDKSNGDALDLEISVDETQTPTSPEEHFLFSSELRRLGVQWVSMAPRFVGRFEKGADYIGDLKAFEADFARHAAIARFFGNYRLSLHTGSDKFSIYSIAARQSRGLLHLKTAGTSYLEALRVIAQTEPGLFRRIFGLAVERYETDRVSYHVSAVLDRVPDPAGVADHDLHQLLDQFDARQALHVTFGAALERFGPQILETMRANEDMYYEALAQHFRKHLAPLEEVVKNQS